MQLLGTVAGNIRKCSKSYTTSIMTAKVFCAIVRYRKKKSGFECVDPGKGKKMLTAIHSSYLYLKSLKNAALNRKEEWGFGFVCSDKKELERNTVMKDVGLS